MAVTFSGETSVFGNKRIAVGQATLDGVTSGAIDVGLGYIKYFDSLPFREINIAISGVGSGSVIIIVR